MSVKVTVTPIISILDIPGDTAPIGDPLWLPSVFNGVEIEFDLKFT
jgi:hypothetical protein